MTGPDGRTRTTRLPGDRVASVGADSGEVDGEARTVAVDAPEDVEGPADPGTVGPTGRPGDARLPDPFIDLAIRR